MERVTRIAFLSEHASPVALLGGEDAGGQNVYVDEVSRNLGQMGYAVDVFTRRDSPDAPEVIEWAPNVRVINIMAGPTTFLLKDALWQFMPDFRNGVLNFIERNEIQYNLLHSNFWMSGWVATELRTRLNIPVVHIFHAMGKTKRKYQGDVDTSPQERIDVESYIINSVERIIAQCPSEESELIDDYGANPERVIVIPSAVNTTVFHPIAQKAARRHIGVAQNAFVVVYVGRMLPRKDVRNVVRGMAELVHQCEYQNARDGTVFPSLQLLLVGGETTEPDPVATPEIGALEQLIAELGIEKHVSFVGKRQQDTLYNYYSAGNVAVTTPWYEPFGLTPLEGMACGRPVIGSAVGGIAYTIADGKTGFLVPSQDPKALANGLYALLIDPKRCTHMGLAARRRVEREFTWETVAQRTSRLYEAVIATHKQTLQAPLLAARESQALQEGK